MRKNNLVIASAFAFSLVFAGAGCNLFGGKDAGKSDGSFTSIQDAVNRSVSIQCQYTDESGETTIASIKGRQIRMDSVKEGEDGKFHGIIRDNKMWIWADKQPEGMMLDFTKITDDSLKMGDKVIRSQDDIVAKLEDKKDTCKGMDLADSEFNLPENIKFTDVQTQVAPTSTQPTATSTAQ